MSRNYSDSNSTESSANGETLYTAIERLELIASNLFCLSDRFESANDAILENNVDEMTKAQTDTKRNDLLGRFNDALDLISKADYRFNYEAGRLERFVGNTIPSPVSQSKNSKG